MFNAYYSEAASLQEPVIAYLTALFSTLLYCEFLH